MELLCFLVPSFNYKDAKKIIVDKLYYKSIKKSIRYGEFIKLDFKDGSGLDIPILIWEELDNHKEA